MITLLASLLRFPFGSLAKLLISREREIISRNASELISPRLSRTTYRLVLCFLSFEDFLEESFFYDLQDAQLYSLLESL